MAWDTGETVVLRDAASPARCVVLWLADCNGPPLGGWGGAPPWCMYYGVGVKFVTKTSFACKTNERFTLTP